MYYSPDPAGDWAEFVYVADKAQVVLHYYFYFSNDFGTGCHSNDLERATFTIEIRGRASDSSLPPEEFIAVLVSVEGAAHGSIYYANRLLLTRGNAGADASLPIALIVEEGKHSICPDRNGDGVYTPGYDVNVAVNEAWGVRDVFGSGFVGGGRYRNSLAKPRWPDDRIRFAGADPEAWNLRYRAPFPFPQKSYDLRLVPVSCRRRGWTGHEPEPSAGCSRKSLDGLIGASGLDGSRPMRWLEFVRGMKARSEGHAFGISVQSPLFEELFSGGVIGMHIAARLLQRESSGEPFGAPSGGDFGIFYTPSLSSFIDWYARVGYGLDSVSPRRFKGMVAEAGIEFRWFPRVTVAIGAVRRKDWSPVIEIGLLHFR